MHSKNKVIANDVNIEEISKRCLGMSGADLGNIMNEAAINSARKNKKETDSEDILEAIDRVSIGLEKKGTEFSKER